MKNEPKTTILSAGSAPFIAAASASLGLECMATVATHASPAAALAAALGGADPADRIVVFGSFYTVGGVLENGLPQRSGRNAA